MSQALPQGPSSPQVHIPGADMQAAGPSGEAIANHGHLTKPHGGNALRVENLTDANATTHVQTHALTIADKIGTSSSSPDQPVGHVLHQDAPELQNILKTRHAEPRKRDG